MRVAVQSLILLLLAVLALPVHAVDITAVRSWRAPDNTRLVLDLSGPVNWSQSPDSTPARLVIDLAGAVPAGPIALPQVTSPLKAVRLEKSDKGQRLVIDTLQEVTPRIFQLPPNEKYSQRLVVDLFVKATTPPPSPSAGTEPP